MHYKSDIECIHPCAIEKIKTYHQCKECTNTFNPKEKEYGAGTKLYNTQGKKFVLLSIERSNGLGIYAIGNTYIPVTRSATKSLTIRQIRNIWNSNLNILIE